VGGNAQIKSMKKVAGTLKLDQAQFRELEAFAKFGSDLDASTKLTIERGRRNLEILKQPQFSPVKVEDQVAIIYAATNGLLDLVPVDKVRAFETEFRQVMQSRHPEVLKSLKAGKLDDEITGAIRQVAKDLSAVYASK
jgi:F-type H+-transporting ATPase subunit alpha